MVQDPDDKFYDRADAHIHLSNDQMTGVSRGEVSASMMYATARFNAWVSACGFAGGEQMKVARDETIEYFVTEFRKMLEDNLDDYISNHEGYMRMPPPEDA
ncbi:MAG: DUF3144 domain-containing protein [Pseudomonadota bacterium]